MINKRKAIDFSWEAFKKNWQPFVVLAIFSILAQQVPHFFLNDSFPVFSPAGVVSLLASAAVGLALATLSLKVVAGKTVDFSDIFSRFDVLLNFVLVNIAVTVLTMIGFILLIVPGIIIGSRLFFAVYFVVDKNLSFEDSIKASWKLTEGKVMKLIFFQLVLIALNILGVIALGVGLLIAIPVTSIASVYVYKELSK